MEYISNFIISKYFTQKQNNKEYLNFNSTNKIYEFKAKNLDDAQKKVKKYQKCLEETFGISCHINLEFFCKK